MTKYWWGPQWRGIVIDYWGYKLVTWLLDFRYWTLRSDTLVLHLGRYQCALQKETLSKEKMASYLPLWCAIEMLTLTTRCLDFMGTNELMLSDHTAIIDVTTIQGDIFINIYREVTHTHTDWPQNNHNCCTLMTKKLIYIWSVTQTSTIIGHFLLKVVLWLSDNWPNSVLWHSNYVT
jgi:hypothetical protein